MLLYVTDGLEESERAKLGAHVSSGCPACAGALAEAQATVAHLPMALPQATPPTSARDKLLSRVAADASPTRAAAPGRSMWPRLAVAACVGAIIAGLAVWSSLRDRFNPSRTSDLQFVSLKGAEAQPKARGRVFWDLDHNNWHVQVFDMKPPPPGQLYELWFVPKGKPPVPAGMFNVDQAGRASMVVAVPTDIGPIALAAVTNEPAPGPSLSPTGNFQLTGQVP